MESAEDRVLRSCERAMLRTTEAKAVEKAPTPTPNRTADWVAGSCATAI